jgi:hypothetical protein
MAASKVGSGGTGGGGGSHALGAGPTPPEERRAAPVRVGPTPTLPRTQ